MPRGGPRPNAGRKRGSRNKAVIEREILAEQIANRARMNGEKLGKEVLAELMTQFCDMAERARPKYGPNGKLVDGNERDYERWARLVLLCAKELAPYQSPTFKAVAVASPNPSIDRQVINLTAPIDQAEAARVYKLIMDGEVDVVS